MDEWGEHMKATLITLLLAFAAAGCVNIPTSTTPITTESGKPVPGERIYQRELTAPSPGHTAKLSFLRDAGFPGGACAHKILVDGKVAFAIRAGEYQTLYLAPGRYLLGMEIEGGVCPARSLRHQAVLSDKAEETYRILIPSLAEGPTVLKIDATTGRSIGRFAYVGQIAGPSGSPGPVEVTPSLSAQRPQPTGTGWRINFHPSSSNPVVVDGVLYVGSVDGAVYALDLKTGETKWRFQTGESLPSVTYGAPVITVPRGTSMDDQMAAGRDAAEKQRREGIRRVDMTPAVENGTVFIGSGDQSFYAIDAATGKKKWSYVAGPGMVSLSSVPAAVLKNGTVYFVTEDGLHALDALTGKRKWLFETLQEIPKQKYMPRKRVPEGPVMGDGVIFLTAWPIILGNTPLKSFVYAVDPESGKAKWVTSVDGRGITEPVAAKGLVFVAAEDPPLPPRPGHPHGFSLNREALYAINAVDGQIKWKLGADRMYGTSRLLIAGNTIYFSTETSLLAVELETGRQLWSFSADGISRNLQADDKHLYVVTHKDALFGPKNTLHALARSTGQEKWSQSWGGSAGVAMIHDGVVYAGRGHLRAIDAATGKELWSFEGTGRESARLISGGRIFLTSPTVSYIGLSRVDQGYLYAIDAKTGELDSR